MRDLGENGNEVGNTVGRSQQVAHGLLAGILNSVF